MYYILLYRVCSADIMYMYIVHVYVLNTVVQRVYRLLIDIPPIPPFPVSSLAPIPPFPNSPFPPFPSFPCSVIPRSFIPPLSRSSSHSPFLRFPISTLTFLHSLVASFLRSPFFRFPVPPFLYSPIPPFSRSLVPPLPPCPPLPPSTLFLYL